MARAEANLADLNEALACVVLQHDFGLEQSAPVAPAQQILLLERRHHHCFERIEHADVLVRFEFEELLQQVSVAARSTLDDRQHLACHPLAALQDTGLRLRSEKGRRGRFGQTTRNETPSALLSSFVYGSCFVSPVFLGELW